MGGGDCNELIVITKGAKGCNKAGIPHHGSR